MGYCCRRFLLNRRSWLTNFNRFALFFKRKLIFTFLFHTFKGAPRLLQAVAKDDLIPILAPLAKSYRGEPLPALLLTLCICECGILIADIDKLTALLSM